MTAAGLVLPQLPLNAWPGFEEALEPVARRVRIFSDHRNNYPVIGSIPGVGLYPFAYREKYLYLTLDLYRSKAAESLRLRSVADRLVAKIHPASLGSLLYSLTPRVLVAVPRLARTVLCPGLVMGESPWASVVLEETGDRADPESLVRRE